MAASGSRIPCPRFGGPDSRPALHPSRLATWALLLLGSLILPACGGAASTGNEGAVAGTGNATPLLQVTAVVTADLDFDGFNDVLEIPLERGSGPESRTPACWRGRPDGVLERAADWHDHPQLAAIRRDLQGHSEQTILADEGAHRAPPAMAGGKGLPYVVLHLEHPDAGPSDQGTDGASDPHPTIEAVRPDAAHPGALVGIRGRDFARRGEEATVFFDDLSARVLLSLPHFILTIVPPRAPLGDLKIVVRRGGLASRPASFEVLGIPSPRLDEVHPRPLAPGILAVLLGRHLGTPLDDVIVEFGGVKADHVVALGQKVIVEVPARAVSGRVVVTVNGVSSRGIDVRVEARLAGPKLRALAPNSSTAGSLIRVAGENLFRIGHFPRVRFGAQRADVFGREKDALLVVVPAGADGAVSVEVDQRTSNALRFDLLERARPIIDRINPNAGRPGQFVEILGSDLYDLLPQAAEGQRAAFPFHFPTVTFGGKRALFVFPTVEGLSVLVPFHAQTGDVVVRPNDGSRDGLSSNAVPFTVR